MAIRKFDQKIIYLTLDKSTIPTYYVNDARITYCSYYIDLCIMIVNYR